MTSESTLGSTWRSSRVARALQTVRESVDESVVARISRAVVRSEANSRSNRVGAAIGNVARNSFLYRWLTAEPDSEVVVIDLRETWTVGPFLTVLERSVQTLGSYWAGATSRDVLERSSKVLGKISRESIAIGALVAAFEPPEPPERDGTDRNKH